MPDTVAGHGGKRPRAGRKPKQEQRDHIERFNQARADKEVALSRLRHMEAEVAEGRLVPVDLLRDVLADVSRQIAAHLDAIPGAVRREAPHLTATDLFLIEREITKARNLAAQIQYKPGPRTVPPQGGQR